MHPTAESNALASPACLISYGFQVPCMKVVSAAHEHAHAPLAVRWLHSMLPNLHRQTVPRPARHTPKHPHESTHSYIAANMQSEACPSSVRTPTKLGSAQYTGTPAGARRHALAKPRSVMRYSAWCDLCSRTVESSNCWLSTKLATSPVHTFGATTAFRCTGEPPMHRYGSAGFAFMCT
jgi:hypothetical protein